MIGCHRITGRHTSDNIVSWYEGLVSDLEVQQKIEHVVVTDSASNIKKAFLSLPG